MNTLTDAECKSIILQFLATRGKKGATEEEIAAVLSQCNFYRVMGEYVNLLLKGELNIDYDGTEIMMSVKDEPNWQWN